MGAYKKNFIWMLCLIFYTTGNQESQTPLDTAPTQQQTPGSQISNTQKSSPRKRRRKNKKCRPKRRCKRKKIKRQPRPVQEVGPQIIDGPVGQFVWPLAKNTYWISSFFGRRNLDDGRGTTFHYGLDMAALTGTPIIAAANGRVVEAGSGNGYGKTVLLKHAGGYKTRYAHMHTIKAQQGQMVIGGKSVIGAVGATGNVRGNGTNASHLHFEILRHHRHLNPLDYLPQQ